MTPLSSPQPPQPRPRKRSSERRQRNAPVSVRFMPDERADVDEKARDAGLSLAAFMRASSLGTPGPRARRSPPVNAEALGRATAALNRVGSNLNQIAHALNAGGAGLTTQECFAALAEVRAAAASIRAIVMDKEHP
jgi:hypothetical protein